MKAMARTVGDVVRELCLGFPETQEVESHGSPNFKVAGKAFAIYSINHHGDGRVALLVASPPGTQQMYTEMEPQSYFIPPYVGPKGWLGIDVNGELDWQSIAAHTRDAWENIAPAALKKHGTAVPAVKPPSKKMTPAEINPFLRKRSQNVLTQLKTLCQDLPETVETTQFGNPTWKAGKKTFLTTHYYSGRLCLQFWVGGDQQGLLVYDERYSVPAYTGHNGWITLDVEDYLDVDEVTALMLGSYRHFALKRMLSQLDESAVFRRFL